MIQAVIPTIPGREQLLAEAVASLERHGIDPVIIRDSPSCGEGWAIGLQSCTADYVLLASDDIEAGNWSALEVACRRAEAGLIVSPVIVNADGSLQGAGGLGLRLADGATARNTIFPFARRGTFEYVSPWPPSNHYCDYWISERAWKLGRGPIVTHGFEVVHKIISEGPPNEVPEYDRWRSRRLDELADTDPGARRETLSAFRLHEGRGIVVGGLKGRVGTELRLASASVPKYFASGPSRAEHSARRTLNRGLRKLRTVGVVRTGSGLR